MAEMAKKERKCRRRSPCERAFWETRSEVCSPLAIFQKRDRIGNRIKNTHLGSLQKKKGRIYATIETTPPLALILASARRET